VSGGFDAISKRPFKTQGTTRFCGSEDPAFVAQDFQAGLLTLTYGFRGVAWYGDHHRPISSEISQSGAESLAKR
jgi:hypothetical protein